MANLDFEDIPIFHCMEEDSILDEFLFHDSIQCTAALKKTRKEQEQNRVVSLDLRKSSEKRQRQLQQVGMQESTLNCSKKSTFGSYRAKSPRNSEIIPTSCGYKDAVTKVANSVMTRTPSLPSHKANSWWKGWIFHKPRSHKSGSWNRKSQSGRARFQHEVHKKLSKIELKSLTLKSNSDHDLRPKRGLFTLPQPCQPKKSLSISFCCPGLSRMHCKQGLFKRVLEKFKIISKSKERQSPSAVSPENIYLLRWKSFIRIQQAKKTRLKRGLGLKMSRGMNKNSQRFLGLLQGKLWYIINAKNIDFSLASRMLYAPNTINSSAGKTKQKLMRHVIQYTDVLQNYPELSWLVSPERRKESLTKPKHLTFTSICTHLKGVRGQLRCSNRFYLKRYFCKFQEWLNDSHFICTSSETALKCYDTAEFSVRTNDTEINVRTFEQTENTRCLLHRATLCSYPSPCKEQEYETGVPTFSANQDSDTSMVSTHSQIGRLHSDNRPFSKASSCCKRKSDVRTFSSNDKTARQSNHRALIKSNMASSTKKVSYRKPERLQIPLECVPRRRSLYENVCKDTAFRCCENDPRLHASKQMKCSIASSGSRFTSKINHGLTNKGKRSTIFYSSSNSDNISMLTENPITDVLNCNNSVDLIQRAYNSKPVNSENNFKMLPKVLHNENMLKESCYQGVSVSSKCGFEFGVDVSPQEQESFDQVLHGNFHDYCLKSDMLIPTTYASGASKTLLRVNTSARLCHPSIAACLTKKDTMELLEELCDVVRPLSPFAPDESPHLYDAIPNFKNIVEVSPEVVPLLLYVPKSPDSLRWTETKRSKVSRTPSRYAHSIECKLCGTTFFKLPKANVLDMDVTKCASWREAVANQKLFPEKELSVNKPIYNEESLSLLGHENSVENPTNAKADFKPIQNGSDFSNKPIFEPQSPQKPGLPFQDTSSHKLLLGGGNDLSVIKQCSNNKRQTSNMFPKFDCNPQCPCAMPEMTTEDGFVGHLLSYKSKIVPLQRLSYTALNLSNPLLLRENNKLKHENSYQTNSHATCEEVNHSHKILSNASNNHGNMSAEERPPGIETSSEMNQAIPMDLFPEGPSAVAANSEQDYICDNMSIPIVLSASDRVYHVSTTSYEQSDRAPVFELPSTRSISQRETNLGSAMASVSCDSFLNEFLYSNISPPDIAAVPHQENNEKVRSDQGSDLLSRAMETAGLLENELETFLASESSLGAFFEDQSEFNLDAFLSGQPGCSEQIVEDQTENTVYLDLDFVDENVDSHQPDTCSILPHTCLTEINRGETTGEATPHIHLDTSPAMRAFYEAPTFKLGAQNEEDMVRADLLTNGFHAASELGFDHAQGQTRASFSLCACGSSAGTNLKHVNINVEHRGAKSRFASTNDREHLEMNKLEDCRNNTFLLFSPKGLLSCSKDNKTNCYCKTNKIKADNQIAADTQPLPCMQNCSKSEPEILDLQPLSRSFYEKEVTEQEDEYDEVETVDDNLSEGKFKNNAFINHNNSEAQIKDYQLEENGQGTRTVSFKPSHQDTRLWSSLHHRTIHKCVEKPSFSSAPMSQPVSHSYLQPETSEVCRQQNTPAAKTLITARSLIRLEKTPASKPCKSKNKIRRERVGVKKSRGNKSTQNKKLCKGTPSSTSKISQSKHKKGKRKTKTSETSPSKLKSKSAIKDSSKQIKISAESRPRNIQNGTPFTCKLVQKQVVELQQKPSELSGDHLAYENLRAGIFSQQLCSFSPGFLKKVPHASAANFLKAPVPVNKIATKFPRHLGSLKKSAAASKKTWRSGGNHNKSNNNKRVNYGKTCHTRTTQTENLIKDVTKIELTHGSRLCYEKDGPNFLKRKAAVPAFNADRSCEGLELIGTTLKSVLIDFPSLFNRNNNSNQKSSHVQSDDDNEFEVEGKQETKDQFNPTTSCSLDTQLLSRLKRSIPNIASDSIRQKEAMKCELPRIGKNMENFQAARRKLKEVNKRLTKIHGKQDVSTTFKSAPGYARSEINPIEVVRGRREQRVGEICSTQRLQQIVGEKRKGGLSKNNSLNNMPNIRQTNELSHSESYRNEAVEGKSSNSPRRQTERQRCTSGVPIIPKLQDSLQRLQMNEKESATLSKKLHNERKGMGDTLINLEKEAKSCLSSDSDNKFRNASSPQGGPANMLPHPVNSNRDLDNGLVRFVERLNSGYGQQLTNGNREEQARLENLCGRYMESLKMRKSLEKKLTGTPLEKLDKNSVRAPLGMKGMLDTQDDTQKRKRKMSSVGELYNDQCVLERHEKKTLHDENLEKDSNENMKIPAKNCSREKQHSNIILSKNSIFADKGADAKCKKKSASKLSLSGESPRSKALQLPIRKVSPVGLKTINLKQAPQAKSTLQLRPALKESVNRLSSRVHSPVERLQYDISTWETKFGKSFKLGLFDTNAAENRDRNAANAGSCKVICSPRQGRHGSLPGLITSPTRLRNVSVKKSMEKRSLSNSSVTKSKSPSNSRRPATSKTTGHQKNKEEKINTFFGSLLNLIDQKEKQKAKQAENCAEAESKLDKNLQQESSKEQLNNIHREERRDKTDLVRSEKTTTKEDEKDKEKPLVKSNVGTMYRNMLETIKAKRSSCVVDPDDPWVLPPFPDFKEMSQSPESMLNLPNYFSESEAKGNAAHLKSSDNLAVSAEKKPHILSDKKPGGADDIDTVRPAAKFNTRAGKQSFASGKKFTVMGTREDKKGDKSARSPDSKICKTESKDSNSLIKGNEVDVNTESIPKGRNAETALSSAPAKSIQQIDTEVSDQLPKVEHTLCVEMKPPPVFTTSTISDSTTTICASRGGGDSSDRKEGAISVDASPNVSFASEFVMPVDVSVFEPKFRSPIINETLNVNTGTESLSPRNLYLTRTEPYQRGFEKTGSEFSTFGEDETVSWTELHDIKKLEFEAPLYKNRSVRTREMGVTDVARFEPYSDQRAHNEGRNDVILDSPLRRRLLGSDRGDTVVNHSPTANTEFDSKGATWVVEDKSSTDLKSVSSFTKQDGFDTENSIGSANYNTLSPRYNRFSNQRRTFHEYQQHVGSNAYRSASPHNEFEIKSLDTLEQQAEQEFGAAVYRRSHYDAKKQQSHWTHHRVGDSYSWRQSSNDRKTDLTGTYSLQRQVTTNSHIDHQDPLQNRIGSFNYRDDLKRSTNSHHDFMSLPSSNFTSYPRQRALDSDRHGFADRVDDMNHFSSRRAVSPQRPEYMLSPRTNSAEYTSIQSRRHSVSPLRPDYRSTADISRDDDIHLQSPRQTTSPARPDYSFTTGISSADDENPQNPRHTVSPVKPDYTAMPDTCNETTVQSPRHTIPPLWSDHMSTTGTCSAADPDLLNSRQALSPQRVDYITTPKTDGVDDSNLYSPRHTLPSPIPDYTSTSGTEDLLKSDGAHDASSRDAHDVQYSVDIPWDQMVSSQVIPLNNQSPVTMYDSIRRSIGHTYLAPIQEESEEDQ